MFAWLPHHQYNGGLAAVHQIESEYGRFNFIASSPWAQPVGTVRRVYRSSRGDLMDVLTGADAPSHVPHREQARFTVHSVYAGVACLVLGYVSARLQLENEGIGIFRPVIGIMLAVMIRTPVRLWWISLPVMAIGNVAGHLLAACPLRSAGIDTLAGMCGAVAGAMTILRCRSCEIRHLETLRQVVVLAVLGGGVSSGVSGLAGATFTHFLTPGDAFGPTLLVWGSACMMSILLVSPLILTLPEVRQEWLLRERVFEGATLLTLLWIVAHFAMGVSFAEQGPYPMGYAVFPLLVWSAIRFGPPGASLASIVVATVTLTGALLGQSAKVILATGPVGIYWIQVYLSTLSALPLVLAALWAERTAAVEASIESQEQYRRIVETSMEGIWAMDQKGLTTFVNPQMARMLGHTVEEMLGRPVTAFMFPEDSSDHEAQTAKSRQGLSGLYERRLRHKDGHARWISVSATPLLDHRGRVAGSFGMFTDITERKRAEQAVRESEQRLRGILENISLAAVILDPQGNLVFCNEYFLRIAGYRREEVIDCNWFERFLPLDVRAVISPLYARMIQTGEFPAHYENDILTRTGQRRTISWSNTVLRDVEGCVTAVSSIGLDVTDRREAEETVVRERAFLRQVIDAAPGFICVKSEDGIFALANKAIADAYGTTVENLEGKTDADFNPNRQEVEQFLRDDREVISSRQPKVIAEEKITCADGRSQWLTTIKVPLLDRDGRCTRLLALATDITARKQAEEALRESEARYRLFFDSMLDGFALYEILYDEQKQPLDYRLLDANPAFERLIGVKADAVIGKTVRQVLPDAGGFWIEAFGTVASKGEPFRSEYGSSVIGKHFEVLAFRTQTGQLACVLQDISERRLAEEALAKSQERYRTIYDNSALGIFELTPEGKILSVNAAYARMYGFESPEQVLREIGDAGANTYVDPPRRAEIVRQVVQNPGVGRFENRYRRRDGSEFIGSLTLQAIRDTEGSVLYLCGFVEDITERKQAEGERHRLDARMAEIQKLESLSVLAGGIAHDFNNLLAVIVGSASLAAAELKGQSTVSESVQMIEAAARRATELTNQMLAYSGKGAFMIQPVSLSAMIGEMTHLLEATVSKKITLCYRMTSDLPPIEADITQMRQIVMNLVTNASEAVGNDEGVITIATGLLHADRVLLSQTHLDEDLPEGRYVYLDVSDTGCGMTEDIRARIFDPFFSTKFVGRGLGLAAVLGIVRGHHGAIVVDSKPDKGTTVRVMLPLTDLEGRTEEESIVSVEPEAFAATVLVVDDESWVCIVARKMLERAGYRVLTAGDGREAVQMYRELADQIALVVLDLTMPGLNGEEAFDEMRRIRPDACVILSSGFNEQEVTHRFAGKGLAGFIHKPYNMDDLISKVRHVLES